MTPRSEVYAALDTERDYQRKWEGSTSKGQHSIEEFLVYIEDYVNQAKHRATRGFAQDTRAELLNDLRKITALGVAAMEQHGASVRA